MSPIESLPLLYEPQTWCTREFILNAMEGDPATLLYLALRGIELEDIRERFSVDKRLSKRFWKSGLRRTFLKKRSTGWLISV
jgi:hypothetical protein